MNLHGVKNNLVYLDEYGLLGSNFYWHKHGADGLSKEDLAAAGLTSDRVQVHRDLIEPLQAADQAFQNRGYRLYVKEGYRSPELYAIVYQRRVEKFGQALTDRLLNVVDQPHADGGAVDVAPWIQKENKEVYLRNWEDGADALLADFYKNKTDESSKKYQELQEWMIGVMQRHGFRLGRLREYFHFNYRPNSKPDYPLC